MDVIALLIVCLFIISLFFLYKGFRLKKEVYDFTSDLEENLNRLIIGKELKEISSTSDSLCGKIQERLIQINKIWRSKNDEILQEKEIIKELISDISHQTKTPIANMKIYHEILLGETQISKKDQEFLRRMENQIDKLDFLIHSLLKMSRLETGIIEINKHNNNLSETISHAITAIVPFAERKHIQLHVNCNENVFISHDKKWTGEAIFNILENAVKYTHDGDSIRIIVSVQEIFTKISIKDNGKGVAIERQAEIFKRFYREPEVHDCDGIGVGLYLARKIMTLQNGYIEVKSEINHGAEFCIYLPND